MKHTFSDIGKSLSAVLIFGFLSGTAHAQYDPGIVVSVPFTFNADGIEIAAGTYRLQLNDSQFLMSVLNLNTGSEQLIPVHPEESRSVPSQGGLIFQVCEGQSYLTEVHIPGGHRFSETVNGRMQNNLGREHCSNDDTATVVLR
jgi:hypothetical protein